MSTVESKPLMGRRSRLTAKTRKRIIDAVRAGNYLETAASYAGVHRATLHTWITNGRKLREQLEARAEATVDPTVNVDPKPDDDEDKSDGTEEDTLDHIRDLGKDHPHWPYCEFHDEVEKARAVAECRSVAIIQRAGDTNWQAHAWFLERTARERWGRYNRVELSGPNNKPVQITATQVDVNQLVSQLSTEELAVADKLVQALIGTSLTEEPGSDASDGDPGETPAGVV